MRTHNVAPSNRLSLALESLEGRCVPAVVSVVTASLSAAGLLTITGDDRANVLTIKVTGANAILTPDANTNINGAGAGNAVALTGTAKSMRAILRGGDDSLTIDNSSDFILPGSANIDLGDGNNTLNMTTSQKIELGSLKVAGGDGDDQVTVDPGPSLGKVFGAASINLGAGVASVGMTIRRSLDQAG